MGKNVRAAAYHRVSRSHENPQLQQDEMAELIGRRGWTLTSSYTDEGASGSRDRRPEVDRLLVDARRRRWDLRCPLRGRFLQAMQPRLRD